MAAGDSLVFWDALAFKGLAANGAHHDEIDDRTVLVFDGATDWMARARAVLPRGVYAGGGIRAQVTCSCRSATSGSFRLQGAFDRNNATSNTGTDSFAAYQSVGGTASGSAQDRFVLDIVFTSGQIDSIAAGEQFEFELRRDADGTSGTDDIATDVLVESVELREA